MIIFTGVLEILRNEFFGGTVFDVASSPRRPMEDILTWHGGVR